MKKRLFELIDYLDMSVRGFEAACDLQRGNISNMSDTSAIGSDKMAKIFDKFPNISLEWLLTGNGSMLKNVGNIAMANTGVAIGNDNNGNIDNRQYYSDSPDVLRAQVEEKDRLLKEKEERIKEKDAQIKEKDAQINKLLNILQKAPI
jgi:hypothetical protein